MIEATTLVEKLDRFYTRLLAEAERSHQAAPAEDGPAQAPAVEMKDRLALGRDVVAWLIARDKLVEAAPKERQESPVDGMARQLWGGGDGGERQAGDRGAAPRKARGGAASIKLRDGQLKPASLAARRRRNANRDGGEGVDGAAGEAGAAATE